MGDHSRRLRLRPCSGLAAYFHLVGFLGRLHYSFGNRCCRFDGVLPLLVLQHRPGSRLVCGDAHQIEIDPWVERRGVLQLDRGSCVPGDALHGVARGLGQRDFFRGWHRCHPRSVWHPTGYRHRDAVSE